MQEQNTNLETLLQLVLQSRSEETYTREPFKTKEGFVDVMDWARSKNLDYKDYQSFISGYLKKVGNSNFEYARVGSKRYVNLDSINLAFNTYINTQINLRNERNEELALKRAEKERLLNLGSAITEITSADFDTIVRVIRESNLPSRNNPVIIRDGTGNPSSQNTL